jgi:dihydrofolate synthase/folylpolyglutamate synthase
VRSGLSTVELPGRFQIVPGQPALVLDVAHNGHAAAALAANLDAMGYFPATHAVFGAMADKELASIWARMHPLADHWYFTDLPTPRAATGTALQAQWQAHQQSAAATGPARAVTPTSQAFADPASALSAALAAADPADRIVVFGSFYTVGGVLQQGLAQRAAPHLAP